MIFEPLIMITLKEIRDLNPCYDPTKYLPEDWQGTVADLLKVEDCPRQDRIWVAVRLIDPKTALIFAVWCSRDALALVPNPDPRSLAACDVAERYAKEQVTANQVAWDAAWENAWDHSWDASMKTHWDVAWEAARQRQIEKLLEMLG